MPSTTLPEFGDDPESISSAGESTLTNLRECIELLDRVWPGPHPASPDGPVRIPEQFGRFRVIRELGRGGFGVVFLAEDPELGRKLALKVPRVEVLSHGDGWRGFLREARAAARLDHPNLVPLLETGTIGVVGYIASVYVDGPSLEGWLASRQEGMTPRQAASLTAVLAEAIEHAHQRGILHRDLKPANVLLQPLPTEGTSEAAPLPFVPRVCDFGLAKLVEAEAEDSRSMVAAGSPAYMAPEQAEGKKALIGPATDVYGLGAILYQTLTGRAPFGGASSLEILRRVVSDEPVPPRRVNPEVPRDLEAICLKCLAKRPDRRYPTAAMLAADLQRFLDGRPTLARPARPWEKAWKWSRRHPALATLVLVGVLTLGLAVGGLIALERINRRLNRSLDQERGLVAGYRIRQAQQAMTVSNLESAQVLLRLAASTDGAAGARGFAWNLLDRQMRDRLRLLGDQGAMPSVVRPSPDGRLVASGDERGGVRIWDLESGGSRLLEPAHRERVHVLAFSADCRLLASAANTLPGEVMLWEVRSGRLLGRPKHNWLRLSGLWFTPDGKSLLAFNRVPLNHHHRLLAWDPAHLELGPSIADTPWRMERGMWGQPVQDIADLLDGNGPTPRASRVAPHGLAFTRDGSLMVAAPGDGTFEVLAASAFERVATGRVEPSGAVRILYSHGVASALRCEPLFEQLAARGAGPDLRVTGHFEELALLPRSGDEVVMTPRGAAGPGLALGLVDDQALQERAPVGLDRSTRVKCLAFLPDGRSLVFGAEDGRIRLLKLDPSEVTSFPGHAPAEAWDVVYSPDGKRVATAGDDHTIRLWDPETGQQQGILKGHGNLVTAIAWSPDGDLLASTGFDRKARIWDAATGAPRLVLEGHTRPIRGVAISPDGALLATGSDDGTVRVWDLRSGKPLATLMGASRPANGLAFSPDGKNLATGSLDGLLVLWDRETWKPRTLSREKSVFKLAYSPDGKTLAVVHQDAPSRLLDLATGQSRELLGHRGDVNHLAFSPDGLTVATAGMDKTVRIWDAASGQEMLCLTGHKARVRSLAFSPDGRTLVSVDHAGALRFWRATPAVGK